MIQSCLQKEPIVVGSKIRRLRMNHIAIDEAVDPLGIAPSGSRADSYESRREAVSTHSSSIQISSRSSSLDALGSLPDWGGTFCGYHTPIPPDFQRSFQSRDELLIAAEAIETDIATRMPSYGWRDTSLPIPGLDFITAVCAELESGRFWCDRSCRRDGAGDSGNRSNRARLFRL
jgi:hypothetical protein